MTKITPCLALISALFLTTGCSGKSDSGPSDVDTPKYSIGGTVTGLQGGTLEIQNNGSDTLSISSDGTYSFATKLEQGSEYTVSIKTQPENQECSIESATGKVLDKHISTVTLTCADKTPAIPNARLNKLQFDELFEIQDGAIRELRIVGKRISWVAVYYQEKLEKLFTYTPESGVTELFTTKTSENANAEFYGWGNLNSKFYKLYEMTESHIAWIGTKNGIDGTNDHVLFFYDGSKVVEIDRTLVSVSYTHHPMNLSLSEKYLVWNKTLEDMTKCKAKNSYSAYCYGFHMMDLASGETQSRGYKNPGYKNTGDFNFYVAERGNLDLTGQYIYQLIINKLSGKADIDLINLSTDNTTTIYTHEGSYNGLAKLKTSGEATIWIDNYSGNLYFLDPEGNSTSLDNNGRYWDTLKLVGSALIYESNGDNRNLELLRFQGGKIEIIDADFNPANDFSSFTATENIVAWAETVDFSETGFRDDGLISIWYSGTSEPVRVEDNRIIQNIASSPYYIAYASNTGIYGNLKLNIAVNPYENK